MLTDFAALTKTLTARGGKGLRPSKPTKADGLTRYVWRMARFHSGADVTMPVTCAWDLQDWADEHRPGAKVSGILNAEGKQLSDEADALAVQVLEQLGMDTTRAARRWAPLLGL